MNVFAILIMIIATMMGGYGALMLKKGSGKISFSLDIIRNMELMIGVITYGVSVPIYLVALKMLPVSVAYPMTSMTYIWSTLLARKSLGERITSGRGTGILMIVLGIVIISV